MKYYLSLIIALVCTSIFAQSAWTKKKGEIYTQLAFTTINDYNQIFGNPDYQTERNLTDNTFQIYGEYGITDNITIMVNLPVKLIEAGSLANNSASMTSSKSITRLGNIDISIKHLLSNKKWIISTEINLEANTSAFDNSSGIRTGFNAWSFTPTINFGRSFKKYYTQVYTGLNIRTNGYSTNFKLGGEVGTKPLKKLTLIAFVDILKSFKDGSVEIPPNNLQTALYINNQEYGAFGLKIIGALGEKYGINAGFGGAFFGRNVAKSPALTLGVYHNF
ncbi:hypothetical protein [Seonamhaeicola aphaedonensis]|uniref:Outer membrane beta-barrel porin/alpha-amylase n=1 Tax=Seonamhaeicola aphaedonensis TaxID=1461338 RepID=A0A3D9HHM6_9FLAO|nr:hypothetical protein [Seonamhaeicola aphaedonensis]RED48973.1 hypothetical protein DFQ02_103304 [Seonamhaeicola aphaedonensis]